MLNHPYIIALKIMKGHISQDSIKVGFSIFKHDIKFKYFSEYFRK